MTAMSYLLVIQKSGLPVYAQSFEFQDDDACRSFNRILKPSDEVSNAHLMGGYFSSMQLFADEMVADKLKLIELGFSKFGIQGMIKSDVFFVGIFQHLEDEKTSSEFLERVANKFLATYSLEDIHDDFVSHKKFMGFTDILLQLSNGQISKNACRNCLTKCTVENKGCLPHSFYFDRVEIREDLIRLKSS